MATASHKPTFKLSPPLLLNTSLEIHAAKLCDFWGIDYQF
jgi:hypothetical protein